MAASTSITRTFTGLRAGTWSVEATVPGFRVTTDKSSVTIGSAGERVAVTFTFTRTDAALAKFSTGFVTLTGPTTVRMPVAPVRSRSRLPPRWRAPAPTVVPRSTSPPATPVSSTSARPVWPRPRRWSAAPRSARTSERTVVVPAGTKAARFVADAANDAADLDLTVYRLNAAGTPVAVAGQSATGAADETVTLLNPVAASYPVVVNGSRRCPR
ncbi:hypothetical protein [Nocardioides sp. B-3]|uniref:hypothetical protein n=1 Tax=Nocardioides sp. B-3 TaxID=2895565 RepID=UPI003FA5C661